MAAQQAGERRLRALYPEPGHRQWVAPPPAHLVCSLCVETFGRAVETQVRARFLAFCFVAEPIDSPSHFLAATPSAGAAQ